MKKFNTFFERNVAYANILLRVIMGWRCVLPAWLFISGSKPIDKFIQLLTTLHFPVPNICAYISIYTQFVFGILIFFGLWTRPAALLMTIHFLIIVLTAHLHDDIVVSFTAWALLAMSVSLLFAGGGKFSIDSIIRPPFSDVPHT
jgi:putative oxidoreductase